jgi:hypothetical protein
VAIVVVAALLSACQLLEREAPVARSSANYGWLRQEQFVVTGSGTAGSATGTKSSDGSIRGHLFAVHLDYASGISTTTDITLSLSSPSLTVLALTNNYTDTWYYPAVQQTGSDGSAISGAYDRMPLSGRLAASIADSSAVDVVTVTVWYGE